ncbi:MULTISPECIES: ogr/Delta-like zinc finger family protein [Pandoraea]|uniref:ogr/Delta-like zinc finger family protein n=1 Tax=Pandoraea TaxID=93217 RepID=UPI001F5C1C27|nr:MULTISPECIES: ogr/Delta-like zinc finger family protein [Pandoraea]MCI3205849.1 transcriptional regulator [Pandoraea sp. LA3]MDN4583877.1 transcriptional regulator [Pandoraea capi]
MKLTCPHCAQRLKIRTSRKVTRQTSQLYYQCENVECAFTCMALLSIVHTLAPSQSPDPTVFIPAGKAKLQQSDVRQMDLLNSTA